MNNSTKEQTGCDTICKSHSARTERDLYRICPSKLSKRELEDLYFALLENNLELKKNINIYQDKIKVLSTKLQRMTVQKNVAGKEKDCCASKAVVNEQKESLTDLKKNNERMADRIRILNMRLCSAKQFLKRSPSQSNNCKTCSRCSFKNSSMSALNPRKKSDANMRTTAVSCQFLEKDVSDKATRTVETETDSDKPDKGAEERCNENKCKTTMDELKEKINNLQEELATSHGEYSERIAKLESLVSELHDENLRVRSEHVASEHALQQRVEKADQLQDQLRTADAKCNELNMELSIEKRKVAELETGLKLANLSNHVIETIDQLAATKVEYDKQEPQAELSHEFSECFEAIQMKEKQPASYEDKEEVKADDRIDSQAEISRGFSCLYKTTQNNEEPVSSNKENNDLEVIEISRESSRSQKNEELASSSKVLELPTPSKKPDAKNSKSDDSGYTELNRSTEADDDQAMIKMNRELLKKIAELQTQLDVVKIAAAGENVKIQLMRKPMAYESYDKETHDTESNIMAMNPMANLSLMLLRDIPPGDSDKKYLNETELSSGRNSTPFSSVPEDEPSASRPWGNLLIKEQSEDVENVIEESSNNSTAKVKFVTKPAKEDEHNSYQIPGPLPAVYPASQNSKDRRKSLRNQNMSKESYDRLKKKAISEERTVKIFQSTESESATGKESSELPVGRIGPVYNNVDEDPDDLQRKSSVTEEAKLAYRTRDSIYVNKKKLNRDEATMAQVKSESDITYCMDSMCTLPLSDAPVINNNLMKETSTQVDDKPNYELCEARATICRCLSRRRDVSVFRSCSGTLRFRTSAATQGLRRCDCQPITEHCGTQMGPPQPARRDSATYTAEPRAPERRSRAPSPGNTDQEISSLSDLPSEKDGKASMSIPRVDGSPRVSLSPGEERGTMTSPDTETDTGHIDYGSLSEGEMPAAKKVRDVSAGEWTSETSPPVATSSERMEATLQSITEELARCRRLLLSQRSQENSAQMLFRRDREPEPTKEELGIELRQSPANRHIVESNSLSCVFILHIGTLVLSDESVLYCRDKTLLLTWKFYTQNAAMTRVQSGRVVQFDFVTEYDVAFNDDFLDYMKHSDMAIVLCEMNKQDEPFAMCSLPLREALLHANRRADMSLALIPASNGRQRDSIGDEIGILDLWCNLRVDVSLLPTIHRVMHTPSPNAYLNPLRLEDRDSKIIQQAVDDEVSSERLSRDLDISITKPGNPSGKQTTTAPELFSEKFNPRTSMTETELNLEKTSSRYVDEGQGFQALNRRRSSQTQKSTPSSDLGHKGTVGFTKRWPPTQIRQESSGIIINEVPAPIRSSDDMKLALERNVQHDMPRMPKMDDESSHFHSTSMGSMKTSAVRHQLSKLRLTKNKLPTRDRIDSLEELLKKKTLSIEDSSSMPLASTEGYVRDQDSERSKMINISKYVATTPEMNKIDASKKSVKYNDTLAELQKDSSADSEDTSTESIDITILWLALNEECEAMVNSSIQKLYVAYSFLGHRGADLETPFSLPKPKHYADKCYFNFKKTFHLHESDLPLLGHMSRCRAGGGASTDPRDCIVFTLISEPAEDPLGLSNCEDVGYAYLYLGDVLAYSGDSAGYTEVVGVRGVRGGVCGVLAVRVDQLPVLRRALALAHSRAPRRTSKLPACHLE